MYRILTREEAEIHIKVARNTSDTMQVKLLQELMKVIYSRGYNDGYHDAAISAKRIQERDERRRRT